jgi:predicted nuclease of predicted toxin-antitoxin system
VRILLDENLDWRLRRELSGHTVDSVPLIGWAGLKNGELLTRANGQYDVFVTMDANVSFQQHLAGSRIAVVVLKAASNRLADTRSLMTKVLELLPTLSPATCTFVS